MERVSVIIKPKELAEQNNISVQNASAIIRDLVYAGQFTAMSDGETIIVFLPDTDTERFKNEKKIAIEYEKSLPSKDVIAELLRGEDDEGGVGQ